MTDEMAGTVWPEMVGTMMCEISTQLDQYQSLVDFGLANLAHLNIAAVFKKFPTNWLKYIFQLIF